MSEQAPTPAHRFGVLVAQLCEQRISDRRSIASWVGRLSVAAAESLLEKATVVGMDTKAIWEEFGKDIEGGPG